LTREFIGFSLLKFSNGTFKPIVSKIFDWKDVAEAHKMMENNENIGKIILKIGE